MRFRLLLPVVVAAFALWLPFAIAHANPHALWLAVPFLAANLLLAVSLLVTLINNWTRTTPRDWVVAQGSEPDVAVIVPTSGETTAHVRGTIESVLNQDWPKERLIVLLSDDADSDLMRGLAHQLAAAHAPARVHYVRPPRRGTPERKGDAKAGNLNAALDRLDELAPDTAFIETRDADDLVGDRRFLRRCVGQLAADPEAAFVQTAKEAVVSRGDPFDNLQPHFFRGSMLARHAANAVFPCGSGLLWRRTALEDIGGFPTWNLVEDLQSGVEALRRGWRGVYLPIRGAVGQHAPEDLPNAYKQRGTWAVDTIRLLLWGDLRGLSLRQRLHFAELGLFYLQSFATLVFLACPVLGLATGLYPLQTTYGGYALHFWPFAVAIELQLAALGAGQPYEALWRARRLWVGLAPVYARACVLAVLGGPNRKPVYHVTRKHDEHRWHLRASAPQLLLLIALVGAGGHAVATQSLLRDVDLGSLYWSLFFAVSLASFLRLSWFGVPLGRSRRRARPAPAPRVVPSADPVTPRRARLPR